MTVGILGHTAIVSQPEADGSPQQTFPGWSCWSSSQVSGGHWGALQAVPRVCARCALSALRAAVRVVSLATVSSTPAHSGSGEETGDAGSRVWGCTVLPVPREQDLGPRKQQL